MTQFQSTERVLEPQTPSIVSSPNKDAEGAELADAKTVRAAMEQLEKRIGSIHFNQRLGIEEDKEARVFGQGRTFFHIENWSLIGVALKYVLTGTFLINRGKRNARAIHVRRNRVLLPQLPEEFDGYTLLHISDPHLDMAEDIPTALIASLQGLEYDICVFTGDFRGKTYGDTNRAIAALQQVRPHIRKPVYAVLGNHDSLRMAPAIEALKIRLLLNENLPLSPPVAANRDSGPRIWLAGIDDPHYYRADNFDKAAKGIPREAVSILLAHSPEVYRHAAFAEFDLMLCGHTHGGQICLPGGMPVILNADCPREFCTGAWRFRQLHGYTAAGSGACVLDVRFNCPPEITLHTLVRA